MLTGKKSIVGNKISRSNIKTKTQKKVNIKNKRVFVFDKKSWQKVKVTPRGMRMLCINGFTRKYILDIAKKQMSTRSEVHIIDKFIVNQMA